MTEIAFNSDEFMSGALELTIYMRTLGIPPLVWFAFIYSEAEVHRKHFQDIAQMDGWNLRYFKDREDAAPWLKYQGNEAICDK